MSTGENSGKSQSERSRENSCDLRIEDLLPDVYVQLRRAAQQHMNSERPGHTLSATAVVHEVYLKLCGPREIPWSSRAQFYTAAAEAMRQILLDHAKARKRHKRGGAHVRVDLDATHPSVGHDGQHTAVFELLALDQAIRRLETKDRRMFDVVQLRFYAGLDVRQTSLALGIAERTVILEWKYARAWLARELASEEPK